MPRKPKRTTVQPLKFVFIGDANVTRAISSLEAVHLRTVFGQYCYVGVCPVSGQNGVFICSRKLKNMDEYRLVVGKTPDPQPSPDDFLVGGAD